MWRLGDKSSSCDAQLGRDVAVKVLPPHLLDSPEALARFEREARAVAALNHPNILALHDIGREGTISYAVTELLEGETLRASAQHRAGKKSVRVGLEGRSFTATDLDRRLAARCSCAPGA